MRRMSIWPRFGVVIHLLIVLTACSSGGNGDTNNNAASFIEPDLNGPLFEQYSGSNTPALLDGNNLKHYVSALFSDTLDPFNTNSKISLSRVSPKLARVSRVTPNNSQMVTGAVVNQVRACVYGGTESVAGSTNNDLTGLLEVNYSNCRDSNITMHGSVTLRIVNGDIDNFETIAYFKKVLLKEADRSYTLSGRSHSRDYPSSPQGELTLDMVLVDLEKNTQVKLENFVTSYCLNCTGLQLYMRGRIFHSDFGYIDVSTSKTLQYIYGGSANPVYVGELVLDGALDTSAILTYDWIDVYRLSVIDEKEYVTHVRLDQDGDFNYEVIAKFHSHISSEFEIYDIDDSDGDGMHDGWERYYRLDPDDNIDADLDTDKDGFSNQLEYNYYGDPGNNEIVPILTDLSLEIVDPAEIARAGHPQELSIIITNPNPVYGATDVTVTVTKSTNVVWDGASGCAWTEVSPEELSCKISNISQGSFRTVSVSVIGEVEEFNVSAIVTSASFDNVLDNNNDTLTATFNQRAARIGFDAAGSYAYPYYYVAAIGYTHVFDLRLYHLGADPAHNAVFRMNLPDHVRVESASFLIDGALSKTCEIDLEVVCDLGTLYRSNSISYILRIEVTGESEGYSDFVSSLMSDAIDSDLTDNSIAFQMFVGRSIQSYQDQINSSTGPVNVTLDAGMYVGSLDYSGKEVTVNGVNPVGATIVHAASPIAGLPDSFKVESNGIVRDIVFQGSGRSLTLDGVNILVEKNIFENRHHGTIDNNSIGGAGENILISKNIFRNIQSDYGCSVISLFGPGPYRIENNLMYDNDCTAITMQNLFPVAEEPATHIIINNTVINNLLGIREEVILDGSVSRIMNNIIYNNQRGIEIQIPIVFRGIVIDYDVPVISNNLFWGNVEDILTMSEVDIQLFSGGLNINQSPMFVDVVGSNYRLSNISPAIDAGTDFDAPLLDIENFIRPIDGDLDSIPQTDIGAYEYR